MAILSGGTSNVSRTASLKTFWKLRTKISSSIFLVDLNQCCQVIQDDLSSFSKNCFKREKSDKQSHDYIKVRRFDQPNLNSKLQLRIVVFIAIAFEFSLPSDNKQFCKWILMIIEWRYNYHSNTDVQFIFAYELFF